MKLLFRGTNKAHFEHKQDIVGFYYGTPAFKEYETPVHIDLMNALTEGTKKYYEECYQQNDTKPLLIVINAEKYKLKQGFDDSEVVIKGKISLKDITVISTIEDLLKICPSAEQDEIDIFKKYYLGM